jgi:hypothetical protein
MRMINLSGIGVCLGGRWGREECCGFLSGGLRGGFSEEDGVVRVLWEVGG